MKKWLKLYIHLLFCLSCSMTLFASRIGVEVGLMQKRDGCATLYFSRDPNFNNFPRVDQVWVGAGCGVEGAPGASVGGIKALFCNCLFAGKVKILTCQIPRGLVDEDS